MEDLLSNFFFAYLDLGLGLKLKLDEWGFSLPASPFVGGGEFSWALTGTVMSLVGTVWIALILAGHCLGQL